MMYGLKQAKIPATEEAYYAEVDKLDAEFKAAMAKLETDLCTAREAAEDKLKASKLLYENALDALYKANCSTFGTRGIT